MLAIGHDTFKTNTTGTNSGAVGRLALQASTTGDEKVAIGMQR